MFGGGRNNDSKCTMSKEWTCGCSRVYNSTCHRLIPIKKLLFKNTSNNKVSLKKISNIKVIILICEEKLMEVTKDSCYITSIVYLQIPWAFRGQISLTLKRPFNPQWGAQKWIATFLDMGTMNSALSEFRHREWTNQWWACNLL